MLPVARSGAVRRVPVAGRRDDPYRIGPVGGPGPPSCALRQALHSGRDEVAFACALVAAPLFATAPLGLKHDR